MKIINGKAQRYVKFLVYGCQMNVADAERMAGQLADIGYERLPDDAAMSEADLLIINTCAVPAPPSANKNLLRR